MSISDGTFELSGNLQIKIGAPIDDRMTRNAYADLTSSDSRWVNFAYVGMETRVVNDPSPELNKKYVLTALPVTDINNWKESSSGGTGSGATFTPDISVNGSEFTISWTNDGGLPNPEPVTITSPKGDPGNPGSDGDDGVTFTPHGEIIGSSAVISWTNDGGLPNPDNIILTAPQGIPGTPGTDGNDGLSAYQVAVKNGFVGTEAEWLASLKGTNGTAGSTFIPEAIVNGNSVTISWSNNSGLPNPETVILTAPKGDDGVNGDDGATFTPSVSVDGTEITFSWSNTSGLPNPTPVSATMPKGDPGETGSDGLSAYQVAVKNGFVGTEAEWLASLGGIPGPDGATFTPSAVVDGNTITFSWTNNDELPNPDDVVLTAPKGDKGDPGTSGSDGKSAYQVAVDEGYTGTEAEWLATLVGSKGDKGDPGTNGTNGVDGATFTPSATVNGNEMTVSWTNDGELPNPETVVLTAPKGDKGENGTSGTNGSDGKSAYQIALDEGFIGDEAAWLASLVGPKGENGTNGKNGVIFTPTMLKSGNSVTISWTNDSELPNPDPVTLSAIDKKVLTFTSDNLTASNTVIFTHDLNTTDIICTVYDNTGKVILPDERTLTDANTLTIDLTNLIPIEGSYKVVVMG